MNKFILLQDFNGYLILKICILEYINIKYTEKSEKYNCDNEIDWSKQCETGEKIDCKLIN